MTETTQNRRAPYSYRPPKSREEEFERLLAASGLPFNAFITEAVFGRSRHRPAELRLLAKILGETAQISDRQHEILLNGGTDSGADLQHDEIRDLLIEIRAALFVCMGRKP